MTDSAASKLSIMHVCAPAAFGGLESVVQSLCRGLAMAGHDLTLVAVVDPGADTQAFLDPVRAAGVRVVQLEIPPRAYVREVLSVSSLMEEHRPDVLHTHGHRPDLLHPFWARRRGVATVTTLHGFSDMGGESNVIESFQKRALTGFDAVIAVSKPLARALVERGLSGSRLHVVPNVWTPPADPLNRVESRTALGLSDSDDPVIGWVGRLYPIKGPDLFLRAIAQVSSPGWVACLIGDGPDREQLVRLAKELGIERRVRFVGMVKDAARHFQGLDAFVLSSRSEGTPMALLEAMGSGVPVVATSVGGVPDVLRDGSDGWLVPPGNTSALAGAIERLLSNPGEARRRASLAHERVRRELGGDQWIERHVELYGNAIASLSGCRNPTGTTV